MFNILTLNKIAAVGTSRLGDNYAYGDDVQNPDAVLVRSAAMHDMQFEDNLLAIARAGAGTTFLKMFVLKRVLWFSILRVLMQMLLKSL